MDSARVQKSMRGDINMHTSSGKRSHRDRIFGLDGLRAIAIIGVTLFHMFPRTVRGGYLGVSLFFVLSGYLLAKTGERRRRSGSWRILPYYLKRVQRIYPGLLIVLFVTSGVYFFLERQVIAGIRPELRSIIFGYNNWWQISQNADYFTRITNASPFTPMWFLSIEMQFYLIWPLIFGIFFLLCRKKDDRAGLIFILVLTLISAALTPILYRPDRDVTRLYYGTDTRVYGLLFGVLTGMLQERGMLPEMEEKKAKRFAVLILGAFLAVTVIAYIHMDGQRAFAYRGGMLLMTVLFGALLVFVTDKRLPVGEWLEISPLVWIGKNSYEIYLWQYPVIFLFMYKRWGETPAGPVIEIILILILAAWLHWLTGVITTLRFPDSMRDAGSRKRISLFAASALTVFLVFVGVAGAATAPAEKFAGKDELQRQLEENQRMLQESQKASAGNASAKSTAGTAAAANIGSVSGSLKGNTGGKAQKLTLKYADPKLTNAAPVSTEGVLLIGDSIMLDSSPEIKEQLPDCYIDAVQSRQLNESADVAAVLVNEGQLHQTVVISLGTNGPILEDDARMILNVFDPDISIFWVNLFGRTVTWEKESNRLLLNLEKDYPNLSVIDWSSLIRKHPEWLWEDGEHPNPDGSEAYATLIRESIQAAEANQASGSMPGASASGQAQGSTSGASAAGQAQENTSGASASSQAQENTSGASATGQAQGSTSGTLASGQNVGE